jgi:SAM-dependent methyltransferase
MHRDVRQSGQKCKRSVEGVREPDFDALRRHWDEAAAREEGWASRPSVNRALRWRVIERCLNGVRTVLDLGGGVGAFAIPLAERGLSVTMLDLSPAMLAIAKRNGAHLPMLTLIEGNAIDLSAFADRAFDLVLVMDGAISAAGALAERVIAESCRVTGRTLIATAAHAAYLAVKRELGEPLEGVRGFTAADLRRAIEAEGLTVARAGGIGSLASLCGPEHLRALAAAAARFQAFLDRCEAFDRDVLPDGPGTPDDTGLLAIAERGPRGS